ncbi:MAG TPA: ribonuclease E/G [Caulobacteraceae bacterium]
MSRRFYLDASPGERRAVVTLDGKPERLIVERDGEASRARLGARYAARVRQIEPGLGLAFLDLGEDGEAVVPLGRHGIAEGMAVEAEIVAEARRGKTATAGYGGPTPHPIGLIRPGPTAAERLRDLSMGAAIIEGEAASEAADVAEEAVLEVEHPLPGGGSIAVEPTRALVAVDVDVGAKGGGDAGRLARQVNQAAVAEAARLLRLKALGGLVVFDVVGKGQDGEALTAAARKAFAPDEPGVVYGPVSKLGTLTLALPRRWRPTLEALADAGGTLTPRTLAQRLVRALEREGRADPGARLEAVCASVVAGELRPLAAQLGPRFRVREEVGRVAGDADIRSL